MEVSDTHEELRLWRWRWCLLAVLAVLYCASLPHTVQTLDAGELVGAAWGLTVAHPPGYPLYIWLEHAFMKLCPWGSPFHRAALCNALCVLGAAALLLRLCRSWLAVVLVAAVATAPVVWRYAVLPDVFGLHLLLTVALTSAAFASPSRRRTLSAAVVFGLAAANHQSIIFLLPLLLLVAVEETSRLFALASLAVGTVITVLFYVSLLALHTESSLSWGQLSDLQSVLDHFLRREYGTFQLSGYATQVDILELLQALASAAGAFGIAALVLVVAGCATFARSWRSSGTRAWLLTLACLLFYAAVFFPRMNLSTHPLHFAVRERFFLFPVILLAVLAVRVRLTTARMPRLEWVLTGAVALVTCIQVVSADAYALSDDTVVEDYARNLLTTAAAADKPALVLVDTDTQVFASQYLQGTESGFENVAVVGRGNMFLVRNLEKLKRRWPEFEVDIPGIFKDERRDIFRHFVMPNVDHFAIFHVLPVSTARGRTTFYPLGRRVEAGTGVFIADTVAPIHPRPPVFEADSKAYVESKDLFHEYALYHLARGKALLEGGDREGAKRAFLDGLEQVPYCIPCLQNVCVLEGDDGGRCRASLKDLEENEYNYFE